VAKAAIPYLIEGKEITRPWLGITGGAITQTLAEQLDLPVEKGVYVISTVPDSPADKAGLKGAGTDANGNPEAGGDIITAVDANPVSQVSDLSGYFRTKTVGESVTLSVLRDGSLTEVQVTLEAWPDQLPTITRQYETPSPDFPLPWNWPNRVP